MLSVALTPDGRWVLSGSKDRGVQFWDPRTGDTQLMLQGHKNSGTTLYFLHNETDGTNNSLVQSFPWLPALKASFSPPAAETRRHASGGQYRFPAE